MRRFSRVLAAVVGVVLVLYVVVGQLLALTPVPWMSWTLNASFLQSLWLAIGILRDNLGIYNVLIALVSVALILRTVRPWRWRPSGLSRRRTVAAGFAAFGVAASLVTAIVISIGVANGGAGFAFFTPPGPGGDLGAKADRRVVVGSPDGTPIHADLYEPTSPGPHPVVVFAHGGGFVAGAPGPTPYNRYLADHGYAVLDVDYRLASDTVHNWNTQVGDVGCALTWVTRNSAAAGLDPDRVVTFGESSGGNLAINAAYLTAAKTLKPTCGTPEELPRIVATVGGYPAVDLTAAYDDSALGKVTGRQFIGGPPEIYPDRYRFVDAANNLTAQSPPTLIVQGGADHLVLAAPVKRFADKVKAAGVPARYIELPALDHGMGDSASTGTAGTITLRHALLDWLGRYAR
ncbi:alpha/beta hydrolase [Williamsia phyllosphaerae]|uniref:alpha/beta hydrolase n=1 Tax=Williamsia phyllosphaerae TaxID=885042 RepID=UPI00166E86D4|nr:alpha/beta hydrolase [Williamsia phyllosphaerae]